jgi:hypothetical protein
MWSPEQLLAYLARYTHRIAITNARLTELDETHVSFRWKRYRRGGGHKNKAMRIGIGEFMRRFLLHVLPNGFHRIRAFWLMAIAPTSSRSAEACSLYPQHRWITTSMMRTTKATPNKNHRRARAATAA